MVYLYHNKVQQTARFTMRRATFHLAAAIIACCFLQIQHSDGRRFTCRKRYTCRNIQYEMHRQCGPTFRYVCQWYVCRWTPQHTCRNFPKVKAVCGLFKTCYWWWFTWNESVGKTWRIFLPTKIITDEIYYKSFEWSGPGLDPLRFNINSMS